MKLAGFTILVEPDVYWDKPMFLQVLEQDLEYVRSKVSTVVIDTLRDLIIYVNGANHVKY